MLVLLHTPSPAAQDTAAAVVTLRQWTDAVIHHAPATQDQALRTVWGFTPIERAIIADHLTFLVNVLSGKRVQPGSPEEARLADELAQQMTATVFLERAAMLHADAVMFDQRGPQPPPAATPPPRPKSSSAMVAPGMMAPSQSGDAPIVLILTRDGEIVGRSVSNWNWPFARALLDRITPSPSGEPFVAAWYHATTAWMFRNGQFGEATPHLARAATVAPNDPRILFDRGCLSEALAMGSAQQLAVDDRAAQLFNRPSGSFTNSLPNSQVLRPSISLPSPGEGNARAVDFFRRALAVDPSLVEARVRLARLLALDKRYVDAEGQIRLALTGEPDRELVFFTHLFGARAANGLGHADDAEAHVQAALALYPHAGSALLAASVTALLRTDVPAALSRIDGITDAPVSPVTPIDPWLEYPFGLRRSAQRALAALWGAVPPVVSKEPASFSPSAARRPD